MSSPFKLHVHRWAEQAGINCTMAIMAQQVALNADGMFKTLQLLRTGDIEAKLPSPPPLDQWLGFYTNHDQVTLGVADHLPFFGMRGKEFAGMLDEMRKVQRCARDHPEEMKTALGSEIKRHGLRRWQLRSRKDGLKALASYKEYLEDLHVALKDEDKVDADAEKFGEALHKSPELYFFSRVVLPCLGVYRKYPIALLRRAARAPRDPKNPKIVMRGGEEERSQAVEDLVRLDPQMIHHPTIMRWADERIGKSRLKHRRKLLRWASEGLDHGRFSALQFKESMGGYVAAFSEILQHVFYGPHFMNVTKVVLEASQIRELFNAAARDRSKRKDKDIKDKDLRKIDDGSYTRAVYKYRRLWRPLIRFKGFFDPPAKKDQPTTDSPGPKSE